MKDLVLVQIGDIKDATVILQGIKEALEANFPLRCSLGKKVPLPLQAWNSRRGQYRVQEFLRLPKKRGELALGITDVDIYSRELNFVFGSASIAEGSVVISLYRLHPEFYGQQDEELFLRRTRKEAVHEVGHLFGLSHCPNPACVMSFSNSISDVDRKGEKLCERCEKIIRG